MDTLLSDLKVSLSNGQNGFITSRSFESMRMVSEWSRNVEFDPLSAVLEIMPFRFGGLLVMGGLTGRIPQTNSMLTIFTVFDDTGCPHTLEQ